MSCATCKHWKAPSPNVEGERHGECSAIPDQDTDTEAAEAYMQTHGDWGYESSGTLRTLPSFGCCLWEKPGFRDIED